MNKYFIFAFYLMLIAVCLALGVFVAKLIKGATDFIGAIAGVIIGIAVSAILWVYVGEKLSHSA